MPTIRQGLIPEKGGRQPDSLKLSCQLAILKHVQAIAFRLQQTQGDKSRQKSFFLRGIQGEVCRPVWNRNYLYLNGLVQQVRDYLQEHCIQTVLEELFILAGNIFSRYENRRRMGVELLVLCLLSSRAMQSWELPEKYQAHCFVIDMLVSCRHRFQKPTASAFWSKQSESLLLTTFRETTKLSRLVLALCNDAILKAIAIHCRSLHELEVQLAEDVTEEGLLAIAGQSSHRVDQDAPAHWDNTFYLQKDFGSTRDWYIKDSMLFTPTRTTNRPPTRCERLVQTFPTSFGCKRLRVFRLLGEVVFPPLAYKTKPSKYCLLGPVLETGFYALLLHLKQIQKFHTSFTTLAVARLWNLLSVGKVKLGLTELELGWNEKLDIEELEAVAHMCPEVTDLQNLSTNALNDRSSRFLLDESLCFFLQKFRKLRKLWSSINLPCLNFFLSQPSQRLTWLNCSALILSTRDIINLRRYAIYLERLEGRFTVDTTMDRPALHHADDHQHLFNDTLDPSINIDSSWAAWKGEVAKWPWRCLRHLELKGRINLRVLQLLVGSADLLQTLNVTNWPNEMVSGGMALDDTWLAGIVEANGLHNLKELTLRMESEHYVEEGFMTKTSLATFLNYAVDNCPKLEKIVGEWTKIPDREISLLEKDCLKKGLSIDISNAEPYRDFQNLDDNERFYGMNEGYWRLNGGVSPNYNDNQPQDGVGEDEEAEDGVDDHVEDQATGQVAQSRHPRKWGYVYRPILSPSSHNKT